MKRTALVTGGNRGIGLETCRQLGELGMKVVLGSRDAKEGEGQAAVLRAKNLDVVCEKLDVATEEGVEDCAKRIARAGLHIDVLVNNAGVYPHGELLGAPSDAFREAFDVNFFGPLWACRAFVPAMDERGYGRVVNVTSGYGLFSEGLEGPPAYSISKAALDALTFKLSLQVGKGVKVNAVCPGWVKTRMGGETAPRPVEKGAETVVWLATLPDEGPSGGVFRDKMPLAW